MNLDTSLAQLETAQLVRRIDDAESAYQFKHALTQDSAYESLLKSDRKHLHRLVAETTERVYSDQLDEFAGVLAHHYAEAGDDAKTLEYATRAGDAAAQRFANAEARLYYSKALDALARLPDDAAHRRARVDAIIRYVSVALRYEGPHRSLARLLEAEKLALELYGATPATRNDRLHLARLRYWIAQAYLHGNQPREAIQYLQEVLSVAQAEGDDELRAIPESMLGRALAIQGKFADAEPHLRTATRMLDSNATNHEAVLARGMLGWVLAARGNYAAGIAEGERARTVAVQAGSLTGTALSGMALCLIALTGGDTARLMEMSQETLRVAEKAGDQLLIYIGYGYQAWAESRLGDPVAASASMAKSKQIAQQSGGRLTSADAFAVASAEIALNAGRSTEALALVEQTVKSAQSIGDNYAQGLAHRVWGEALARLDPPQYDQAQTHFADSLHLFEEGDARLEAARTRVAWGSMLRDRGDEDAARTQFERAAAQFEASQLFAEAHRTRGWLESAPPHAS
jgi:tetratricopeptide (TPR) repeat protein